MTQQVRTKTITITLQATISSHREEEIRDFVSEAEAFVQSVKDEPEFALGPGESIDGTVTVKDGPTFDLVKNTETT